MISKDTILEIQNLNTYINDTQIIKNLTCKIPRGRITSVIGMSGAGKSTFLRSIVKLISTEGLIELNEYNENNVLQGKIDTNSLDITQLRKQIVYLPQIPSVFPGTVRDNLKWPLKLWDIKFDEEKLNDILELVDLENSLLDRNAIDLSVGQQQRLALGRVLLLEPKILLLDEPTSSLDPISRSNFNKSILKVTKRLQMSIIIITHSIEQALEIADYILLLHNGILIGFGEKNTFFDTVFNNKKFDEMKEAEILSSIIEKYGGD